MVTLDKIKILTNKNHIDWINPDVTTLLSKNNIYMGRRYSQNKPFKIYMDYSFMKDSCVIEFSSKLLIDRYPELINKNNIHDCFQNFVNIGLCKMDIDSVVSDCELLTCDITTDLSGIAQPDRLAIKACISKPNKFRVQKYGNSGHVIDKLVKTPNRKLRMIIYDKGKELRKMPNAEFIGMVNNKEAMLDYFKGKFRIEVNIKTKEQIRRLFNTETTSLLDVLNSKANPILTIFDEVFTFPEEQDQSNYEMPSPLSYTDLKTVKNALLLEKCEYDMEKIDIILNNTLSPNTDKSKYRTKFIKLLNSYPQPNKNIQVMKNIRELIESSVN